MTPHAIESVEKRESLILLQLSELRRHDQAMVMVYRATDIRKNAVIAPTNRRLSKGMWLWFNGIGKARITYNVRDGAKAIRHVQYAVEVISYQDAVRQTG